MGLEWPSMSARVLIRKLNFLRRLVGEREEKLSSQIFTFLLKGMYQSLQSLSNVATSKPPMEQTVLEIS